jgi:hypothetical protein
MALSTYGRAQHTERTLDEVKAEAVRRAEVGGYPLIGIDPADVQEAFKSIHTRSPDEWATAFMDVANKYENEAKSLGKTDPAKANADYIRAALVEHHLESERRWHIKGRAVTILGKPPMAGRDERAREKLSVGILLAEVRGHRCGFASLRCK